MKLIVRFFAAVSLVLIWPSVVWATSPLPDFCSVCGIFEAYCLADDGSTSTEVECPALPEGQPGTQMETIACGFAVGDTTVEGTCAWSRLQDISSSACYDVSSSSDYVECSGFLGDGETASGLCVLEDCPSYGGSDSVGGCQAAGVGQLGAWLLLLGLMGRRRSA